MTNNELFERIRSRVDAKCRVGADESWINPEDYQLGVDEVMTIVREELLDPDATAIPF